MPSARTIAIGLALIFFLPLLIGLAAVKWVEMQLPPRQEAIVRGPHDLVGVETQGSYAWVVPASTGVVLVDAGLDPQATALKREIGDRKVHAVLVTHGHGDHTGGLSQFPDIPVYASAADIALARGEREPRGWMAKAFATAFGHAPPEVPWQEVADGTELRIDGLRFHVVALPGHTDGSLAFLWEDVIFTGDALLGGDPPSLAPEALADDPAKARQSIHKLLPLDFDAIADGHVGITTTARKATFRLAGKSLAEPTISVRSRDARGDPVNLVQGTGVWVNTPVPDARGEKPTYLVLPDGQRWRIVNGPRPEHAGQRVHVRGRRVPGGGGPGLPVEVDEVIPAQDAGGKEESSLEAKVGQWVTLTGTVSHFRPLSDGALWGEGALVLEGGEVLALAAPVSLVPSAQSGPLTLFGQLRRPPGSKTGLMLVAAQPPAAPEAPR